MIPVLASSINMYWKYYLCIKSRGLDSLCVLRMRCTNDVPEKRETMYSTVNKTETETYREMHFRTETHTLCPCARPDVSVMAVSLCRLITWIVAVSGEGDEKGNSVVAWPPPPVSERDGRSAAAEDGDIGPAPNPSPAAVAVEASAPHTCANVSAATPFIIMHALKVRGDG